MLWTGDLVHAGACGTNADSQASTSAFVGYSREELIKDHAYFVKPSAAGPEATGVSLQTRVTELEGEVARLREQLGKAKGINDTMWETVVHKLMNEGKGKGRSSSGSGVQEGFVSLEDEEQGEDGGRRRKRSRA